MQKVVKFTLVLGLVGALTTFGMAVPASAAPQSDIAPVADGTNGANDGPAAISVPVSPEGAAQRGPVICSVGEVTYTANSATKKGSVTNWAKHIKNDPTSETLTLSTSSTISVGASTSFTSSVDASAGIAKIASVALGLSTNFGINGSFANTTAFSRSATFTSRGSWVIWAGVYTGTGSVTKRLCNSNGSAWIATTGTVKTYDKSRVTGLTNCANSVSDLVEVNAKTHC